MNATIKIILITALCVGAAALIHCRGFEGAFVLDSISNLAKNGHVFEQGSVLDVVRLFPTRGVCMLSFAANHALTGMEPFYFRLTNAAFLGLAASQLFLLALAILALQSVGGPESRSERWTLAAAPALMFLVHPLQSFLVLYVVQRMALLACVFYLASLTSYIATRSGFIRSRILGYGLCATLFLFALFSKESAITLPAVIFLAEIAFFSDASRIRASVKLIAVVGLVSLIALAITQYVFMSSREAGIFKTIASNYSGSGLSLTEVALSKARLFFSHLYNALLPFAARLSLVDAVVVSRSFLDPFSTLLATVGLVCWLGIGLLMLRLRPIAGFGLLYYAVALIPDAFADPKLLFLSYRGALPMPGLLLAVMDGARWALEASRSLQSGRIIRGGLVAVFGLWMALGVWSTFKIEDMWTDRAALWEHSVSALPEDTSHVEKAPRALIFSNLAASLLRAGRPHKAVYAAREALDIAPNHLEATVNLGTAYLKLGQTSKAEELFRKAIRLNPDSIEAYNNLGELLLMTGRAEEAAKIFNKANAVDPRSAAPYNNLGKALLARGDSQKAIMLFNKAILAQRGAAEPHNNLGVALMRSNKLAEAIPSFEKAIKLNPRYAEAHANFGFALANLGRQSRAIEELKEALVINPSLTSARYALGNLMLGAGLIDEAIEHLEKVAQADPRDAFAQNSLGEAYLRSGRADDAIKRFKTALALKPGMKEAQANLETALKSRAPQPGEK